MDGHPGELAGRTCLVTGASSGIGLAASRALAARGAELILLCRDRARGEAAVARVRGAARAGVDLLLCDLASQADVRRAAEELLAKQRPLHVLLHNAGLFNLRRQLSPEGIEETFAVNHLAPFLLTDLLLERLKASAPARVVTVASDMHRFSSLPLDHVGAGGRWGAAAAYGRSKLANILFTRELARRLDGTGVTANALHPGGVATRLGSNNGLLARGIMTLARPFIRTPEQGTETAVYLCASAEVEGVTGGYFLDCRRREPSEAARDDGVAARLWEASARLTGLTPATPE